VRLRITLVAAFLFAAVAPASAADPAIRPSCGAAPSVDVTGLSAADLSAIGKLDLKGDAWSEVFAVYVVPAPGKQVGPALLGDYRLESDLLRFAPRYPLAAGVRYRAVLKLARLPGRAAANEPLVVEFSLPKLKTEAARVTHVYPTTDRLPENQLKFYLHFSTPMARGHVYDHIKLLDEHGKPIELPFLELEEELWDGRQQRLTLFCDPGRIKRGLKPREEVGPVLEEGKRYTLVVDAGLEDASGNPLKEPFRKSFRALAPDDTQPDPKTWKLQSPGAGTHEPLTITFPKPLDQALLERLLWVTDARGQKLPGTVTVAGQETIWQFKPAVTWNTGNYQLVADTRLEDLAGNSIARPFEVDVFRPIQREVKAETVKVPIVVSPLRHP
jgi:hypothetical protein